MKIHAKEKNKKLCSKYEYIIWWLSVVFIFSCFFSAEYLTPMHSDDFSYSQMSLSISSHFNHYMKWSGRILADYASSLILQIHNHFIISAIIAGTATALCFFISTIPDLVLHGISKKSFWKLLSISALFWISNPNLGQTTFWVVGACNYLVTTFFVALFLYVFVLYMRDETINSFQLLLTFMLAITAGCTNENMGLSLVCMLCMLFIFYKKIRKPINNKLLIYSVVGLLIGSAVLLLAPGNYVRLSHNFFSEWREKTIFYKIISHLLTRTPLLFKCLKEALIFYIVLMLVHIFYSQQVKNRTTLSLICFSVFVFSFLIMAIAPLPPRAFSGTFFFLLLATSFLLSESMFKEKFLKGIFSIFLFVGIGLFLRSFLSIIYCYKIASVQADIRNSHINYEKLKHGKNISVTIPSYYIVNLRKNRDMFDLYHSESQASFFGVDEIKVKDVSYDYSVQRMGRKLQFINETDIPDIQIYVKPSSLFYRRGTLLLECSKVPDKKIHVQYYNPHSDAQNNIELSDCIELQGKYYLGATVKNLPNISHVKIVYGK